MPTAGPRVARFIETFLTLGGSYLGQSFRLMDWQRETLDDIYRIGPDGRRLRRTYVLGLPRKNGKSQFGAAIALYHLIADKADSAPQVISAAGDRKQARLVFDEARRMVLSSPDLSDVCTVHRDVITCHRNGGTYRAVSADAGLQQGLNPSCVIFDELHVFKNDELFVALSQGSGTRSQPLFLVISTAGFDLDTPLGRLYERGLRINGHVLNGQARTGELDDTSYGMTWWGPEPGVEIDPGDPDVWRRYNPSWTLLSEEEFKASHSTIHESQFVRYRLNGWTSAEEAWLPHGAWAALESPGLTIPDGETVVLGFDGSYKKDATGLVLVSTSYPHAVTVIGVWEALPNDPDWHVPIDEVKERIRWACRTYDVQEIAADPYRWQQALQELEEEGFPVLEFPQQPARTVPATTALYEAVLSGHIRHDGNPTLSRHLANCHLKETPRGAYITKPRGSRKNIDLAVALAMAYSRAVAWREDTTSEPSLVVIELD